jgi:hypothetical protein
VNSFFFWFLNRFGDKELMLDERVLKKSPRFGESSIRKFKREKDMIRLCPF